MDTPILNQLVEEATGRATELADGAMEAVHAIDALAANVGALQKSLAAEGAEAHQRFQEVAARLEAAEAHLETAAQGAKGGLDSLVGNAGGARNRVTSFTTSLQEGLGRLEQRRDALAGRLVEQLDSTGERFEGLTDEIAQLQAGLSGQLQTALAGIGAFQQAVTAARADFASAKSAVMEALGQIETAANEGTQGYAKAVDEGLFPLWQALVGLHHQVLEAHNEAVVALRKKFTEEAIERLESAIEPLKAALSSLAESCGAEEDALEARSAEIASQAEQALALVQVIAPALAAAAGLA